MYTRSLRDNPRVHRLIDPASEALYGQHTPVDVHTVFDIHGGHTLGRPAGVGGGEGVRVGLGTRSFGMISIKSSRPVCYCPTKRLCLCESVCWTVRYLYTLILMVGEFNHDISESIPMVTYMESAHGGVTLKHCVTITYNEHTAQAELTRGKEVDIPMDNRGIYIYRLSLFCIARGKILWKLSQGIIYQPWFLQRICTNKNRLEISQAQRDIQRSVIYY